MEIEATQAIPLSDYDDGDETDEEPIDGIKQPVAHLKAIVQKGFPETLFPVYEGINMIGRAPGCNIHIDLKALSKQHAVIEVQGSEHFLVDKGSKNKTRRNKIFLKPEVRYEIRGGEHITFADVECVYLMAEKAVVQTKPKINAESYVYEEDDSEPSSDILQPTQAYGDDTKPSTTKKVNFNAAAATQLYATASDDSDTEEYRIRSLAKKHVVAETPASAQPKKRVSDQTVIPDSDMESSPVLSMSRVSVAATETVCYASDEEPDQSRRCGDQSRRSRDGQARLISAAATQAYIEDSEDAETDDEGILPLKRMTSATNQPTQVYQMDVENEETASKLRGKMQKQLTSPKGESSGKPITSSSQMSHNGDEAPTQTYSMREGDKAVSSAPKKTLNLGGETLAYEFDSSDDDSMLLPVKKASPPVASGDETDDGETATQGFDEASTVPISAEDATQVYETNQTKKRENGTHILGDGDSTQNVSSTSDTLMHGNPEEAATQCLGQGDATVSIADTVQLGNGIKIGAKAATDEEASTQVIGDTVVCDSDATQVFAENTSRVDNDATQIFEDSETRLSTTPKHVNRSSIAPADATQVLPDSTQSFCATPVLYVDQRFSKHWDNSISATDSTQLFNEGTPVLTVNRVSIKPGNVTVDAADATQLFSNGDVTQSFDDTQTPILHVTKHALPQPSKAAATNRRNKDSFEFDPTRQHPDTSLPVEDQPTQLFESTAEAATQDLDESRADSNEDKTQTFDSEGFAVPALPCNPKLQEKKTDTSSSPKVVAHKPALNTDDMETQAYSVDSDEETPDQPDIGDGQDKMALETENKVMKKRAMVYTDDVATQAYDETSPVVRTRVKAAISTHNLETQVYGEPEKSNSDDEEEYSPIFTDDLCTQAYGVGQGPAHNTDEMATQAYDQDMPKLAVELRIDASSTNSPSPDRQSRAKRTEAVIESSQQEDDAVPVSLLPQITLQPPTPAVRPAKRKVENSEATEQTSGHKRTKSTEVEPDVKEAEPKSSQRKGRGRPTKARVTFDVAEDKEGESKPVQPTKGKRGRGRPTKANKAQEIDTVETDCLASTADKQVITNEAQTSVVIVKPTAKRGRKGARKTAAILNNEQETDTVAEAVSSNSLSRVTLNTDLTMEQNSEEQFEPVVRKRRRGEKTTMTVENKTEAVVELVRLSKVTIKQEVQDVGLGEGHSDVTVSESQPVVTKATRGASKPVKAEVVDNPDTNAAIAPVKRKRGRPKIKTEPVLTEAAAEPSTTRETLDVQTSDTDNQTEQSNSAATVAPSRTSRRQTTSALSATGGHKKGSKGKASSTDPTADARVSLPEQRPRGRKAVVKSSADGETASSQSSDQQVASGTSNTLTVSHDVTGVVTSQSTDQQVASGTSNTLTVSHDVTGVVTSQRTSSRNVSPVSDISDVSNVSTGSRRSRRNIATAPESADVTSSKHAPKRGRGRVATKAEEALSVIPERTSSRATMKQGAALAEVDTARASRSRTSSNVSDLSDFSISSRGRGRARRGATHTADAIDGASVASNTLELQPPTTRSSRTPSPRVEAIVKTTKTSKGRGRGKQLKYLDTESVAPGKDQKPPTAKTKGKKGTGENVETTAGDTELEMSSSQGRGRRGAKANVVEPELVTVGGRGRKAVKTEDVQTQDSNMVVAVHKRAKTAGKHKEISDSQVSSSTESISSQRGRPKKRATAKSQISTSQESVEPVTKKGKTASASPGPSTPKRVKSKAPTSVLGTPKTGASSESLPGTPDTPSLRRRTLERKPKVMFTGVVDETGQKIIKSLGGGIVESIEECTHLVTDKVRRTMKFLCGVARGLLIVQPVWLERCKQAGMFIDATPFVVTDKEAEKSFKFSLQTSLHKAHTQGGMLSGYKIHVTKNVKPEPVVMKGIITSAGGSFLSTMPKKKTGNMVVVSCIEDFKSCTVAVNAQIPVVNTEFILTGILKQEADVESHMMTVGNIPEAGKKTKK